MKSNSKIPEKEPKIKQNVVTAHIGMQIKAEIRQNPKLSYRKLTSKLKATYGELAPSKTSVFRYLEIAGFQTITPLSKPLLTSKNISKRLEFAVKYHNSDCNFYHSILWSDETSVSLIPKKTNYKIKIHSSQVSTNRFIAPSTKSPLSVMFWGVFGIGGPGPLVVIEGNVTSASYQKILDDHLIPYISELDYTPIFMQDNAPVHTSRSTISFLEKNQIKTIDWPPQSPDINPIENVWAIIKREVESYPNVPSNRAELISRFQIAWNNIPSQVWLNLMNSLPKRLALVKKRKGYWIRY
jgi:DDE superfamily endonuclease/Transposase